MATILHPTTDFDQVMATHPRGFQVILVRVGGEVHGWRNRCPHIGIGLDWGDGRCLSGENELTCAMHGARFLADSGLCVDGPCAGQSLEPFAVHVEDGKVVEG